MRASSSAVAGPLRRIDLPIEPRFILSARIRQSWQLIALWMTFHAAAPYRETYKINPAHILPDCREHES